MILHLQKYLSDNSKRAENAYQNYKESTEDYLALNDVVESRIQPTSAILTGRECRTNVQVYRIVPSRKLLELRKKERSN